MTIWQRILSWVLRGRAEEEAAEPPDRAETAPLHPKDAEAAEVAERRRRLSAGSAQSVGRARSNNEDSLLVLIETAIGGVPLPHFGVFCVADGAGGHRFGEVASAIAVRSVTRSLVEGAFLGLMDPEGEWDSELMVGLVRRAFERAHKAVHDGSQGGVTTLTVAVLLGDQLTVGHVGDSRAYFFESGVAELVTRDHSYPWRLVEIGQLTPEEALAHPKRNLLWNALGKGSNLVVDVYSRSAPQGGYMLLCSDGLWGELTEQELQDSIVQSGDPNEACQELVRAANAAGGSDNITAVLVEFPLA